MKRPAWLGGRRGRIVAVGALLLLGALLYLVFGTRYVRSEVRPFVAMARRAGATQVGFCFCGADGEVSFQRADGLRIAGSVYGGHVPGDRPVVVLLHGNTALGRRFELYPLLASKLARRGYFVLAIDLPGFGASADPFDAAGLTGMDPAPTIEAALDYLEGLSGATLDRIFVVGHSGGGGAALHGGLRDPRVRRIVAMSPPSRADDARATNTVEWYWDRARAIRHEVYGSPFPAWFTSDVWESVAWRYDLRAHRPYVSDPGHPPLLLIVGGEENEFERAQLRGFAESLPGPHRFVTVDGANHYMNVMSHRGYPVYDRGVTRQVVELIDDWLSADEPGRSS